MYMNTKYTQLDNKEKENISKRILLWSISLCFLSGVLDAIGFLKYGSSITHVSGSFCKSSIEIVEKNFGEIKNIFILVFCFFLGSVVSGILISKREFSLKKRYGITTILMGIVIYLSWLLFKESIVIIFILTFISGLQNGMFITYKGLVVRTTHVTGGITDLGVLIGKYIKGNRLNNWKIKFQFLLLLSFFLGGTIGTVGYRFLDEKIFMCLAMGYIFVGIEYFLFRTRSNKEVY